MTSRADHNLLPSSPPVAHFIVRASWKSKRNIETNERRLLSHDLGSESTNRIARPQTGPAQQPTPGYEAGSTRAVSGSSQVKRPCQSKTEQQEKSQASTRFHQGSTPAKHLLDTVAEIHDSVPARYSCRNPRLSTC